MGRFKAPAPPTPARGLKTPMKASSSKRNSKSDLSLVAAFDDLMRNGSIFYDGAEKEFLQFVNLARDWRKKWQYAESERTRLSIVLTDKDNEITTKECQIKLARKMVDEERRQRLKAEEDREQLSKQIGLIKNLITADGAKTLTNETLEQINNIDTRPIANDRTPRNGGGGRHGRFYNHRQHNFDDSLAVVEQSAESLLDASDLSFDDTCNEGRNGTRLRSGRISRRRSSMATTAEKKRKSRQSKGDAKIKATTTVTVDESGQAHAESVIESFPLFQVNREECEEKLKKSRKSRDALADAVPFATPRPPKNRILRAVNGDPVTPGSAASVKRTFSNASSMPSRPHIFQKKTGPKILVGERCNPCGKRIQFGKSAYKCQNCGAVCHPDCRRDVPVPCIAGVARTPSNRTGNFLADFAPVMAPMIPAILVHCIKEIEARGLDETGLWRMSGGEREANEILDKFMVKGAGAPKLSNNQVHDITSCVKKFLRGLKEPIIPLSLHSDFVDAASNPDTTDGEAALYQAISELPLPNRDTLAFLMLHLQTVASNSHVNKMDASNLARILGPTILGYSSNAPEVIVSEAQVQQSVVSTLIGISSDYWSSFLAVDQENILNTKSVTPEKRYFAPLISPMATPKTGGPAKRTRSKRLHPGGNHFQLPML